MLPQPAKRQTSEFVKRESNALGATPAIVQFRTSRHRWRLLDPKFRQAKQKYAAQCAVASLAILLVLLALDALTQTVLIASLGASVFTAFTMPHIVAAKPRYLIGGYLVGTCVGCTWSWIAHHVNLGLAPTTELIVFAAIALGFAMFIMVITDTEHPPAAALTLGYVFNPWDPTTVFVILAGICAVALIKETLKPRLLDLL